MTAGELVAAEAENPAPAALVERLGIKIFRVTLAKVPFAGSHGFHDATSNPDDIAEMEKAHPDGLWAMATGAVSGIDVVDRDMKQLPDGTTIWGGDSLGDAGLGYFLDETPTVDTPRGLHQWYRHPAGIYVKSAALVVEGRPILGVDILGDGGAAILPPGPQRSWDPILGPDTPLALLPSYAVMADTRPAAGERIQATGSLDRFCEAVLRQARQTILEAPPGTHFDTLRRVAHHVAGFCDANGMPASLALDEMEQASQELGADDPRKALKVVQDAFAAGLRKPYPPRERLG